VRLHQITATVYTIIQILLANVKHMIVLIIGLRTVCKPHILGQTIASIERGLMSSFHCGLYNIELEVDIDEHSELK
jgi:hypothetical protein